MERNGRERLWLGGGCDFKWETLMDRILGRIVEVRFARLIASIFLPRISCLLIPA